MTARLITEYDCYHIMECYGQIVQAHKKAKPGTWQHKKSPFLIGWQSKGRNVPGKSPQVGYSRLASLVIGITTFVLIFYRPTFVFNYIIP